MAVNSDLRWGAGRDVKVRAAELRKLSEQLGE
jgi:hypothetical protein